MDSITLMSTHHSSDRQDAPSTDDEAEVTRSPGIIGWGLTEHCNLACPHCYVSATREPRDELTTPECLHLIDTMAELGTQYLAWTGGEPLLRDDLDELIRHATDRGIASSITTNGVLLDERRAASLAAAGTSAIQISLDGSTPERNRAMRGATARQFAAILDGIGACQANDIQVHLAMILSGHNLDDVDPFLDLARRHHVSSVRFCGFVPWGHARRPKVMQRLDLGPHLAELAALVERLSSSTDPIVMFDPAFGPVPPGYLFHDCVAGDQMLYLDPSGSVYPCSALLEDRFRIGSVRSTPLEVLWRSPAMNAMARHARAITASSLSGQCATCAAFEGCHGACRGVTYAHTGDLNASFPRCLRQVHSP